MSFKFPLATASWGQEEQNAMQRVIASGMFTMGANVQTFERDFAAYIGSTVLYPESEVETKARR
jgi:CDP-6-deoxy-D-xylo-4-hexulose-3-dehydrase